MYEKCGNIKECEVRQYYGWVMVPQSAPPKLDKVQNTEEKRECNMCHKQLNVKFFRERKDGTGLKKTCAACEEKYVNKTIPTRPKKKKADSVKATPAPKPTPKVDKDSDVESPRGGAIKLSDFTWLENLCGRDPIPKVKIHKKIIAFNAAAKRKFKDVLDPAQTVNVGYRRNGNGLEIVFDLRPDLFGSYRLTKKLDGTKKEVKVNVSLHRHGIDIKTAAYPVKLVGGVLVVEVG
jgi:hypothetical protein